eukprot:s515_g11.t1
MQVQELQYSTKIPGWITSRTLFCKRICQEPQTQLAAVHVQYSKGEQNGYGSKITVQGDHRLASEHRAITRFANCGCFRKRLWRSAARHRWLGPFTPRSRRKSVTFGDGPTTACTDTFHYSPLLADLM